MNMAAQRASLALFAEAGQDRLQAKRESLVRFFLQAYHALQQDLPAGSLDCLTPESLPDRGCQSSLVFPGRGKSFFDWLSRAGVIADWREPNVVRIAPVPLYNTHLEVWTFLDLVRQGLGA
jgi:kynureninase